MKKFYSFRLETADLCLWNGDVRVDITPKAFDMLRYLVEHAGKLVTPDQLLGELWPGTYINPEGLRRYITEIRKVLGDNAREPLFIETVPRRGYRFVAPVDQDEPPRSPDSPTQAASMLVGREPELNQLNDHLRRSLRGEVQIVFVTGEPGIGKSALVDEFERRALASNPGISFIRGQCVEGYAEREPYYPVLEAIGQLFQLPEREYVIQNLAAEAPTWLVQFPSILTREHRDRLQQEIMGSTRDRMLREIGSSLANGRFERPVIAVLEDLHWADPSTVDFISFLGRQRHQGELMVIGTYRPTDLTLSGHPLKAVKQSLQMHGLCHEIALQPLEESEVSEFLAINAEDTAPPGLADLLYRHTEGNPLFMVAALSHLCNRGLVALENGAWQLKVPLQEIELEAPDTLRQMIELQISRLDVVEQEVLEVACVESVGRSWFSVAAGVAISDLTAEAFEEACEGLARRHNILRPTQSNDFQGGTDSPCYEFVHVLYREVCYRQVALSRRVKLHRRLGEWAESNVPTLNEAATWLVFHFEQCGDWLRAVKYSRMAAETAAGRFEPAQAAEILERALKLVEKLAQPERHELETAIRKNLETIYKKIVISRESELCSSESRAEPFLDTVV